MSHAGGLVMLPVTKAPTPRYRAMRTFFAIVLAAVRADFLGRLIGYPPLKAALEAGPFMVGR